jgi:hypothetical protein
MKKQFVKSIALGMAKSVEYHETYGVNNLIITINACD